MDGLRFKQLESDPHGTFVAAADALGTRTVKCAVPEPEPKKYALWRGAVAMTV